MTEILIGRNDSAGVSLDPHYGNRHGMIAGATGTGTGKSVSLMVLAEGFSRLGVPCFLADAKGDLAGLAMAAGEPGDKLKARLVRLGLGDWKPQANPVIFWDIYGRLGHPVRATISEMGPTLLGRVLELNDTQEGVLEVVFKLADEQGLLLLDLADLRALLTFAADNAKEISGRYGLISPTSIAAIQRALLKLESDDASPALLQRVEQVVRLIRSKGVGVYFCSQNPDDVPGNILGQLGNRIQHALRAFTPRDQKAVKAAAETFVANPKLDVGTAITQLAVGEALASTLANGGVPTPVEQVLVTAPCCRIGAITEAERAVVRQRSPVGGKYDNAVNRESAAELLAARAQANAAEAGTVAAGHAGGAATKPESATTNPPAWSGAVRDALLGTARRQGMLEAMGKSAVRTMGSQLARQILRGALGDIVGGKR